MEAPPANPAKAGIRSPMTGTSFLKTERIFIRATKTQSIPVTILKPGLSRPRSPKVFLTFLSDSEISSSKSSSTLSETRFIPNTRMRPARMFIKIDRK